MVDGHHLPPPCAVGTRSIISPSAISPRCAGGPLGHDPLADAGRDLARAAAEGLAALALERDDRGGPLLGHLAFQFRFHLGHGAQDGGDHPAGG